jgi:serine/threonine-protein kinase
MLLNNRYRIVKELGDGGFGQTFLAEDTQMPSQRKCVIKQLKPLHENSQIYILIQERFQREAALLETLSEGDTRHQIPQLYAYFIENELFYLVEEWVQGQTLTQKLESEGIQNEQRVKDLLLKTLPILEYIQEKGIIHRDIKPDNIIWRNSDDKPVLIDFGAVKETMGAVVTESGSSTSSIVVGTPGFMPSEQSVGRPVFATDIYSLGLTAIYLLTGKIPQDLATDPNTGEIVWKDLVPNLSPELAAILDKSIQSHWRDRYSNAKNMLEALQASDRHPFANNQYQEILPTSISANQSAVPATVISNADSSRPQLNKTPYYSTSSTNLLGGGGTFNTSVLVPHEIQGWNWGAFLLPTLWPFTNQVWIGLLSWIPCVGMVMPFILGAKGNTWAWRSRQWKSLEDFKAHQRTWTIAGLIVNGVFWVLVAGILILSAMVPTEEENSTSNSTLNSTPTENPQTLPPLADPTTTENPIATNPNSDSQTSQFPKGIFTNETWQIELSNDSNLLNYFGQNLQTGDSLELSNGHEINHGGGNEKVFVWVNGNYNYSVNWQIDNPDRIRLMVTDSNRQIILDTYLNRNNN